MATLRVLGQMGTWALTLMMVGCVSPGAFGSVVRLLSDPDYEIGTLAPPFYGFFGMIAGAVFGLFFGIFLETRRSRSSSGGPPASGSGPTSGGYRPGPWGF